MLIIGTLTKRTLLIGYEKLARQFEMQHLDDTPERRGPTQKRRLVGMKLEQGRPSMRPNPLEIAPGSRNTGTKEPAPAKQVIRPARFCVSECVG